MAVKKRNSQYQYEPLVTPEKWTGEERSFSIRLTQILDDLHAKFSGQKETALAEKSELENSIEQTNTGLSALRQTVSSLKSEIMNSSFPVGSCYTTTTNKNPANILGIGTWTLIDKAFINKTASSGFFTYDTTNASAAKMWMVRCGHSIRVRLDITTAVALADSTLALGTLSMSALGLNGLFADLCIVGEGDGANGFSNARVISGTGVLNHYDCVTKTSGGSLTSGQVINYDFILHPDITRMLDSACDQFIWKRTA